MRARVHKHRLAQRQSRQVKGERENRYVIKVMRLNREGGAVPLACENQKMHQDFSLGNNKLYYYSNPIMNVQV